jgi:hypothetical protein
MGHGAVAGDVTNNGTVEPGGTIGTLTVANYTQGANGTLAVEISPTAGSVLDVAGAAQLDGRLHVLTDAGQYNLRNQYIILDAGGSVTGTFSSLLASGAVSLTPRVSYGDQAVTLNL